MSGVHSTTGELSTVSIFRETFPPYPPPSRPPFRLTWNFPRKTRPPGVGIHKRGKRKQKMRKGSRSCRTESRKVHSGPIRKDSRDSTRGYVGRGCITNEVADCRRKWSKVDDAITKGRRINTKIEINLAIGVEIPRGLRRVGQVSFRFCIT